MAKQLRKLVLIAGAVVLLSACSSIPAPAASASATTQPGQQQQQQNPAGQGFDRANMPIEGMLAMGTLSLEGSENAVTAEQAKALLPLWKAVKSLSASETTAPAELTAVYEQIQETMTEPQVQAIKAMKLSQEETQALMKKYGVEAKMPQIDPSRLATRQASAGQTQGGGTGTGVTGRFQGGPGGFAGGGIPPEGGFVGGEFPNAQNAQGTPQAARTPRAGGGGFRGGMNTLFVDPLIKILKERAGG